ncbi:MAG: matrixin family metalloprotease, partial [Myxococcota bacterium]
MKRLALFVLLWPGLAHAFGVETVGSASPTDGTVVRWFTPSIPLELNRDGAPGIFDGSDLDAIRRGMLSWNAVPCSQLLLTEIDVTTETSTVVIEGTLDRRNRLTWVNDTRWNFGSLVLAVTAPVFDTRDGEIIEADIVFNGRQNQWSTDGRDSDIEAVAVHELGHLIGLQHVLGGNDLLDPPTMSPVAVLEMRTLNPDDSSAACFLYPENPYRCRVDCDCPTVVLLDNTGNEFNAGQVACSEGLCSGSVTGPLGGGLGDVCAGPGSCDAPLFCQRIGNESYCARDCIPNDPNDCPAGFSCFPYSNAVGGACLPATAGTGSQNTNGPICQASTVTAPPPIA